jgi:hypothetical protein
MAVEIDLHRLTPVLLGRSMRGHLRPRTGGGQGQDLSLSPAEETATRVARSVCMDLGTGTCTCCSRLVRDEISPSGCKDVVGSGVRATVAGSPVCRGTRLGERPRGWLAERDSGAAGPRGQQR